MARKRGRKKSRSGARLATLALGAGVAAGAAWGLWRLAESRRGPTAERAVPAEDIRPSERNRLEAVLEGLDEGDSSGNANRR